MKIKSYFSRSVEAAMATAREELGSDAMLVNSRKAPMEARHLGEYEVVFGLHDAPEKVGPANETAGDDGEDAEVQLAPGAETASAAPAKPDRIATAPHRNCPPPSREPSDRLSADVAELKRELEGMRRALTRSAFAPTQWLGGPPDLSDAYAMLTANEVNPELAREIVQGAELRTAELRTGGSRLRTSHAAPRPDGAAFQRALVEELETRFSTDASLGRGAGTPRIVALAGPPGAGKTTTLVKLAINYGLVCRRPVTLLSVDTFRVGAAEQLRSYAAILGVGFQILETVTALKQAIEESRNKDLILIDTPGLGTADMEDSATLAHFLSTRPDIDTHLVLSSSMKSADLTRMVDCYEVFGPRRLLFTKLDETISSGPILNEAARTGKPLSFFATGQRIPEDIEAVSASRFAGLILSGEPGKARPVGVAAA